MDRHCAFCCILVPARDVKLCSKCQRRAYCSRDCQVKDWKQKSADNGGTKGLGQGHKNWCGIAYGEEDLDWELAESPGKGFGIFAKRKFFAKERILVDGFKVFPDSSSVARGKFTNHSCLPNAGKYPDPDYLTMTVYANRDIEANEEIFVSYVTITEIWAPFHCMDVFRNANDGKEVTTFEDARQVLKNKWGIICPQDCVCRNEKWTARINELRNMYWSISYASNETAPENVKIEKAIISQLLKCHQELNFSLVQKATVLQRGFNVYLHESTIHRAHEYIEEAYDIWSSIGHPKGTLARNLEQFVIDAAALRGRRGTQA